ncbi:hypothetical protein ABPG74_017142 [Tetrahymena malaccensis]
MDKLPQQPIQGRKYNFNGEQIGLPQEMLQQIEAEWYNCFGVGLTMIEMFNKNPKFLNYITQGEQAMKRLLGIPAEFKIYTMHCGQALQVAAVPLNLLDKKDTATYINSGYWSQRAIDEAKKYVPHLNITQHLQLTPGTKKITLADQEPLSANTAYIHYVSDEPADGIALNIQPRRQTDIAPNALMVADFSADFLTREIDWSQIDVAYVSSEYQIGIAGSIFLIIRESAMRTPHPQCPYMIDYAALKATDGLPNTPPTFPQYMNAQFFLYAEKMGGVKEIQKKINGYAHRIYTEIDAHPLIYQNKVSDEFRSNTHIVFNVLGVQQDQHFIEEANKRGIVGLQNKRGQGVRISLGLATTDEAITCLVQFLQEYATKVAQASV